MDSDCVKLPKRLFSRASSVAIVMEPPVHSQLVSIWISKDTRRSCCASMPLAKPIHMAKGRMRVMRIASNLEELWCAKIRDQPRSHTLSP